jgi:hypothetical protein
VKVCIDIDSGPTSYEEVEQAIYRMLLTEGWTCSTLEISGIVPGIPGEET